MKFGLNPYGTTFDMGIHPKSEKPLIDAISFINRAIEYGLQGVEIPYNVLQKSDIDQTARYLKENNMFANIAAGGYDPDELSQAILAGERIGAISVRTVVGGADFGGDRRHMKGKWQDFVQTLQQNFAKVTATAEKAGVNLAVENHQDLASEELIAMCKTIESERFGITLDTANALATAEEPIDFYKRVMPYVKNVHLKDYWIYWSEEGYRLVRCPIGQGVIDFEEVLKIFAEGNPNVTMSLEHGSLEARNVRILEEDYWTEYPPRSAAQLTRLMRFVHDHARKSGDWRTPFERGESADQICTYELKEFATSLAYIKPMIPLYSR